MSFALSGIGPIPRSPFVIPFKVTHIMQTCCSILLYPCMLQAVKNDLSTCKNQAFTIQRKISDQAASPRPGTLTIGMQRGSSCQLVLVVERCQ